MKIDKDDFTAIAGTIIIHVIALIILYFGVIRTFSHFGDDGPPIAFGEYTVVAGIYQPAPSTTVTQPRQAPPQPQPQRPQPQPQRPQPQPQRSQPQPQQRQNQPRQTTPRPAAQPSGETVITQTREETVSVNENTNNTNAAIAEANAQREREENERRQREREEAERRQREEERGQQINNLASGVFSGSNAQTSSQGEATSGISNQGNPYGDPDSRSTQGARGINPSFNLGGRPVGDEGIQIPEYTESEIGRIVVHITVDPKGNVIKAEAGQGSNDTAGGNITMRKKAEDAAFRTKFKSINGTNDQTGTITYNYINKIN